MDANERARRHRYYGSLWYCLRDVGRHARACGRAIKLGLDLIRGHDDRNQCKRLLRDVEALQGQLTLLAVELRLALAPRAREADVVAVDGVVVKPERKLLVYEATVIDPDRTPIVIDMAD